MKLYVACDHAGYLLKAELTAHLTACGHEVVNLGTDTADSVDYPIYAQSLCRAVLSDSGSLGILICGTGIGMSIAANKQRGIRAALCSDVYSAKMTRIHNNANVLCLGARILDTKTAIEITDAFLAAEFEGGRHQKRVDLLE